MSMTCLVPLRAGMALAGALFLAFATPASAQDRLPWLNAEPGAAPRSEAPGSGVERDALPPAYGSSAPRAGAPIAQSSDSGYDRQSDTYRPPAATSRFDPPTAYEPPRPAPAYSPPPYGRDGGDPGYGDGRYDRPPAQHAYNERPPYRAYDPDYREPPPRDGTFSMHEIVDAGHGFFGSISQGLASVIEYAFKRQGRPNGYILGEDVGGAFVAGLRYGEGRLYTRDAGSHRVYWQGPSVGYDAGAEGSKVMVLVYRLRDIDDIYQQFGGVAGSAYLVGGVGLTFQQRDHIVLAPIRAGVGLRLGANVGYLKYTRRPTWNPF